MSDPKTDNRLEELSRWAADGYTPPGNASWDKMEAALDKVLPTEKKKRRFFFFWWIIPSILIGGSIIWYTQNLQQEKQTIDNTKTEQNNSAKNSMAETLINNNLKKEPIGSTIQPKNTDQQKKDLATVIDDSLSSSSKETKQKLPSSDPVQQKISKELASPSEQKNDANQLAITSPNKKNDLTNTASVSEEKSTLIRPTVDSGSNATKISINERRDTISSTSNNQQESPIVNKTDSIPGNTKKGKASFSFAVVAGLDATTVKFRYADKPSASGGIIIGYHFNNNWSIHTGGLYTRKNYKMAGSDFKAPSGSWVANLKMETVDGFCDMWEIPLLLRYTFDSKTKTKTFLNSGISSYLMTSENYNYYYYNNGLPVMRNANYTTGRTHLFSILKVSGGWIRQTGRNSSLIIEPFANLPLSGFGYGNVRLSSFGINFSYQLRQPIKKN